MRFKSRKRRLASAVGHTGFFAGLGAIFAEITGINAIGWLGGSAAACGGLAAGPAIIVGGGVFGLAFYGVRQACRR